MGTSFFLVNKEKRIEHFDKMIINYFGGVIPEKATSIPRKVIVASSGGATGNLIGQVIMVTQLLGSTVVS